MAYAQDNLMLVFQPLGGGAPRQFFYNNVDADSDASIVTGGFFATGATLGMRVSDLVDVVNPVTPRYKRYQVASVSGATATVAAPTAIT